MLVYTRKHNPKFWNRHIKLSIVCLNVTLFLVYTYLLIRQIKVLRQHLDKNMVNLKYINTSDAYYTGSFAMVFPFK